MCVKKEKEQMAKNKILSRVAMFATAAVIGVGTMVGGFLTDTVHAAETTKTATVTLGKILNVNQDDKFPNVENFTFELEAIQGWDNANISTHESGNTIAPADMPMPAESDTANHEIDVTGTKATVNIGDFTTSDKDNSKQKTRTTDVNITFNKAGYYMYKVVETGSDPANVPGVTYDDHSYYVVVYVANRCDAQGNTLTGAYVKNITSYRNTAESNYVPNLSDIANVSDGGTLKDNNETNLEKVGKSTSENPAELEAYRFWNKAQTSDLTIEKNVRGNLGDLSKQFEFTVELEGLEPGVEYTTVGTGILVSASVGSVDTTAKTITANDAGKATVLVKLNDGRALTVEGLPVTATYKVTEAASDHVASYAITAEGDEAVIVKASDANAEDTTALATEKETVDAADGNVTVKYTNERNLTTITGVPTYMMGLGALALAALAVLMAMRKRRAFAEDDESTTLS